MSEQEIKMCKRCHSIQPFGAKSGFGEHGPSFCPYCVGEYILHLDKGIRGRIARWLLPKEDKWLLSFVVGIGTIEQQIPDYLKDTIITLKKK